MFCFALLIACEKENMSQFTAENKDYTANFSFETKSQSFVPNTKNMSIKIEGEGSYSFSNKGKFQDEIILNISTGVADHKMEFTDNEGNKIFASLNTQIGQINITGTTKITGGTGKFAKILGESTNSGPFIDAQGKGSWAENGKVTY